MGTKKEKGKKITYKKKKPKNVFAHEKWSEGTFFFFFFFLLFGVAPIDWEFIWVAGIACMALKEIWIMMIYLHFFGGV